ncbi:MAG: zinc ABC transporter substrate-binding protein [Hyphomicrobiales bacterium]
MRVVLSVLRKVGLLANLVLAVTVIATSAYAAPLKAVVTVGMVADIVKTVGGDDVDVTTLMGSGVDPHSYRQTRNDVSLLTRADIVFANGLHLEAQLDELLHKLSKRKHVVFVSDELPAESLIEAEGFSGRYDPHVWMDPSLWQKTVAIVRDALVKAAPDHSADFEKRADALGANIETFASSVSTMMKTVPDEKRVLITAHDAFSYFGRAFNVEVIGIQGLSTDSEAGLNRIESMVKTLVDRKIEAVFVESSVSEQNIKALIEGAAAQGHKVAIGGTLFSDAMGVAGTFEGTYLGMIDHNATTITRALGGAAPDRGITGQLTPSS